MTEAAIVAMAKMATMATMATMGDDGDDGDKRDRNGRVLFQKQQSTENEKTLWTLFLLLFSIVFSKSMCIAILLCILQIQTSIERPHKQTRTLIDFHL